MLRCNFLFLQEKKIFVYILKDEKISGEEDQELLYQNSQEKDERTFETVKKTSIVSY